MKPMTHEELMSLNQNPMKVIHIAENTNGYEIVTLLAHRFNRKNQLHVIEVEVEGKPVVMMTGGYLIQNKPEIIALLNTVPKGMQYKFINDLRTIPYVKTYYQDGFEEEMNLPLNPAPKISRTRRIIGWFLIGLSVGLIIGSIIFVMTR